MLPLPCSLLSTLYSVVSAPQAPLSLLRRRLSLCSAGASLSAPQAPLSALHAPVPTAVWYGARHLPSSGAVERWSDGGAGQLEGNASQTTKR